MGRVGTIAAPEVGQGVIDHLSGRQTIRKLVEPAVHARAHFGEVALDMISFGYFEPSDMLPNDRGILDEARSRLVRRDIAQRNGRQPATCKQTADDDNYDDGADDRQGRPNDRDRACGQVVKLVIELRPASASSPFTRACTSPARSLAVSPKLCVQLGSALAMAPHRKRRKIVARYVQSDDLAKTRKRETGGKGCSDEEGWLLAGKTWDLLSSIPRSFSRSEVAGLDNSVAPRSTALAIQSC